MKFGVISSLVLMLIGLNSFGASRTVTTTTLDNMWWPVIPGSLQYEIYNANSGDTIVFDYGTLGDSPVFGVDNRFYTTQLGPNSGGYVVIDGLRNKPNTSEKPKITVTGTPGATAGGLFLARDNTSIIGVQVDGVDGNGIWISGLNVSLDSVLVYGSTNCGINIVDGANGSVIKNSLIYRNNNQDLTGVAKDENAGIYSLGSNTTIDSCFIYGNDANGVLFRDLGTGGGFK